VDSEAIKNHIIPKVVEQLRMLYRQKLKLYTLVMISGDLVLYKDKIINLEIRPVKISIKE
jgi:hypothetical protein